MNCTAEFAEGGYRYKLGRDWSGEFVSSLFPIKDGQIWECRNCHFWGPSDSMATRRGFLECPRCLANHGLCDQLSRVFRYALFTMLNPSTADALKDDPTVAKCIRLARRWGFDGLQVRNIFAIRGTDPAVIKTAVDPVGPKNDAAIIEAAADVRCGIHVAAWGNHGSYGNRSQQVRRLLEELGKPVFCFRVSKQGEPEHPLYQRECDVEELQRWI